jgi:hypothetical protein
MSKVNKDEIIENPYLKRDEKVIEKDKEKMKNIKAENK